MQSVNLGFSKSTADQIAVLQRSPLFGAIPNEALYALALSSKSLKYEAGSLIFSAGDETAEQAFFIVEGEVNIFIGTGEKKLTRRTLAAGELFGEFALFTSGRRTASAEAVSKTVSMSIHKDSLTELIKGWPEIALRMLKVQIERTLELEKLLWKS